MDTASGALTTSLNNTSVISDAKLEVSRDEAYQAAMAEMRNADVLVDGLVEGTANPSGRDGGEARVHARSLRGEGGGKGDSKGKQDSDGQKRRPNVVDVLEDHHTVEDAVRRLEAITKVGS